MFSVTTFRQWASAGCAALLVATLAMQTSHAQVVGNPDPTFNGSGALISDPFVGNLGLRAVAVLVQPDGKTVVVGSCDTRGGTLPSVDDGWGFCAVRYNLDGAIDTSFGTNGRWKRRDRATPSSLLTYDSYARSAALQSDGTIVIAGSCRNSEACVVRVTPAGTSGPLFNRVASTFFAGSEMKVAIQADQKS